jgi:hypothetical protein
MTCLRPSRVSTENKDMRINIPRAIGGSVGVDGLPSVGRESTAELRYSMIAAAT